MTTRRKMAGIESRIDSGDASGIGEHGAALASLLGSIDSLFWPHRYSLERGNPAAIEDRRQLYFRKGVEWSGTNSGGEHSAKENERQRRSMSRAGLIRVRSSKSKSAVYVRFADGVEDQVRRLLGLRPLSDCWLSLCMLTTRFNESSGDCRPGGWVSESRLFDASYESRKKSSDWWPSIDSILPLLVAGIIESRSTASGHIYYRPTGLEMPKLTATETSVGDDSVFQVYQDSFDAGLEAREHWRHDSAEIFIPLSATR